MSTPLYEIHNLRQSYEKGRPNLDIAELSIDAGCVTGVVGPNGGGKSTLLKVLAFLIPASGEIIFDGRPAAGREREIRREVTYLLQESYLLKRSVFENVAYGLRLRGAEKRLIDARVRESLEAVGLAPEEFASRPWYRLSGGEVQRVALAARLALRPKALLLDEPTANVDEASAQLVMEAAVRASREYGAAVIVSTHDTAWLYEIASNVVSLYGGRVAGTGAENIFRGGWHLEGGFMTRPFAGGQALFAWPGASARAAVLSPSDITVSDEIPPFAENMNVLRGVVSQLTLERASGAVLLSADVSGSVVKARLSAEDTARLSLRPSSEIFLSFSYSSLRWL